MRDKWLQLKKRAAGCFTSTISAPLSIAKWMRISKHQKSPMGADPIGTEPAPACPACGSLGKVAYRGLRDLVFGAPGEWTMKRCSQADCRLLWLDPRPTASEIHKAYSVYYTHQAAPVGQLGARDIVRKIYYTIREAYSQCRYGYAQGGRKWWRVFLAPLAHLHPGGADAIAAEAMFLPAPTSGSRLLEIGCGNGYLLKRMQTLGWNVEGIEFDPACVALLQAQGVRCRSGDLREQQFEAASFDAVFMGHVIEHVYNPIEFLKECSRVLRPGGTLVALTPNSNSLGHRMFGRDWRGLEPPRHLQIFNRANLDRMVRSSGFSHVKTSTTNRGAWYLWGASSAISSARSRGQSLLQWNARLLSARGLLCQVAGRAVSLIRPDAGDETLVIAYRATQ